MAFSAGEQSRKPAQLWPTLHSHGLYHIVMAFPKPGEHSRWEARLRRRGRRAGGRRRGEDGGSLKDSVLPIPDNIDSSVMTDMDEEIKNAADVAVVSEALNLALQNSCEVLDTIMGSLLNELTSLNSVTMVGNSVWVDMALSLLNRTLRKCVTTQATLSNSLGEQIILVGDAQNVLTTMRELPSCWNTWHKHINFKEIV